MKKNIFALMATVAIVAASPVFGMNETDLQEVKQLLNTVVTSKTQDNQNNRMKHIAVAKEVDIDQLKALVRERNLALKTITSELAPIQTKLKENLDDQMYQKALAALTQMTEIVETKRKQVLQKYDEKSVLCRCITVSYREGTTWGELREIITRELGYNGRLVTTPRFEKCEVNYNHLVEGPSDLTKYSPEFIRDLPLSQ